jgi:dGTPase
LIHPSQLRGLDLWEEAVRALEVETEHLTSIDRGRIVRYLINKKVSDLIYTTAARIKEADLTSAQDVREQEEDLVVFSPEMVVKNRQLKDFLYQNLYRHWRVMRMQEKAQRALVRLFGVYEAGPYQLPFEVQERAAEGDLQRVICDYIAGMTDRYALQEHCKLFDPCEPV